MKKLITIIVLTMAVLLTACDNEARVASYNVSKAADQFEVDRRIVFFNGITDTYLLSIEGRCSIAADAADSQLEVTCKTGPSAYKKHFLGLSDNVTYFVEQLESSTVGAYRYRVIFRPSVIIPNIDPELP